MTPIWHQFFLFWCQKFTAILSSFAISFSILALSPKWLYTSIVTSKWACPIMYCNTLISIRHSAILVQAVCRITCGCVKYRTKKILFFLPKTIWRLHQVVPAPLVSFDKSFLSCSSYLCSEKISSKFHSISISSWLYSQTTTKAPLPYQIFIAFANSSISAFWFRQSPFSTDINIAHILSVATFIIFPLTVAVSLEHLWSVAGLPFHPRLHIVSINFRYGWR